MSLIKKRKMCVIALMCVLFALCFAILAARKVVHAQTETLEEKIVRFTDSDLLEGQPEDGDTIRDFVVKYKTNQYRPSVYSGSYPVTNIIDKVIPIELFYAEGTHFYMGKEYGFVLLTAKASETSYQNHLLIIDFNLFTDYRDSNGAIIPNQAKYRVEPIFQTYYRKLI